MNGTRAYQLPMTDTCGNQRYVTLDSIIQIIVDSIAGDTGLQVNWYTANGTTTDALRTATIDSAAQWVGNNADGFLYWEMGSLGGGRLLVNTDSSRLFYTDIGGTNEFGAGPSGAKIFTTSADQTYIETPQINFDPTAPETSQTWNLLSTTGTNIYPNGQSIRIFNTGTNPYLRREQTSGITAFFDRYLINSDSAEFGYALGGFYWQVIGTEFGLSCDEYIVTSADSLIFNTTEFVASVKGVNGQTTGGTLKQLQGADDGDYIAWDGVSEHWEVRAGITAENWYTNDGTTTDYERRATVQGVATWESPDVTLDGVYPFRFELGPGPQNEPEMMVWVFPQDSLTLGMSDQEIILNSPGTHFIVTSGAYMVIDGSDSVQIGNIGTSIPNGDILGVYGSDASNPQTVRRMEGTFNADQLSWAAGAAGDEWDIVPANRTSYAETTVNLIPAESVAEIVVTPTGGGTVQLNYTPAMPAAGYTTYRYVYNQAASATTISTDQAWQFQDETGDLGASFSLAAGVNVKLIWIYNAVAADARFFVVRFSSGTGDGDILQGGNSFGTAMTIGTNDNNAVNIEVNGTTGFSMGTDYALTATASTASTNTADNRAIIQTNSTGTAAANFGGRILFQNETSTTDNTDCGYIEGSWLSETHASRKGQIILNTSVNGAMTRMAQFAGNNTPTMRLGTSGLAAYTDNGVATSSNFSITSSQASATSLTLTNSNVTVNGGVQLGSSASSTYTSGTKNAIRIVGDYAPTSGTGIFYNMTFIPTINQTGGANGLTGAVIFEPTLTAVGASWSALSMATSNSSAKFLNQTGANTTSTHVGAFGVGSTTVPTDKLEVTGNVALLAAGNKLKIATGANASMGTATLVGGTVTVNTTAVATGSTIFLTCNTPGGTQGFLSAPAASITNATSFVINSSSGTDTSTVNWLIIN